MYCCTLCRVCAIFPSYSFSWNVAQVTVMHMSQTCACGDADAWCMHVSIHLNFLDSLYSSIFWWSFYFVSIISILTWIWGASPLRPLELWSYSFRSCLWILTLWGHGCFKERGIDDSENWNLADRLDMQDQNTSALYKKILAADYKTPKFISEVGDGNVQPQISPHSTCSLPVCSRPNLEASHHGSHTSL